MTTPHRSARARGLVVLAAVAVSALGLAGLGVAVLPAGAAVSAAGRTSQSDDAFGSAWLWIVGVVSLVALVGAALGWRSRGHDE